MPDINTNHPLHSLLAKADLFETFQDFCDICMVPPDLRCMLRVSAILLQSFTSEAPAWLNEPPFTGWRKLLLFLNEHADQVVQNAGDASAIGFDLERRAILHHKIRENTREANYMQSEIDKYPLYALLTTADSGDSTSARFRVLTLQIACAHWRKICAFQADHPSHSGVIREARRRRDSVTNHVRTCNETARKIRNLPLQLLDDWLKQVNTGCSHDAFRTNLITAEIHSNELQTFHQSINSYCFPSYKPGRSGSGGERHRGIDYSLYADYAEHRYGMLLSDPHAAENDGAGEEGEREAAEKRTRHIVSRSSGRDKSGKRHTNKELLQLGLDPLEFADCDTTVLSPPPSKGSRQAASELARANSRGFEIDRRLLPYGSHAIRLEEFHQDLLEPLQNVANDPQAKREEIAAAAFVAIAAETGRNFDEIHKLRVNSVHNAPFVFQPPDGASQCGKWAWNAVTPHYEAELTIAPEFEVKRDPYSQYSSSPLVTRLIGRLTDPLPEMGSLLFRFKPKALKKNIRIWLKRHDRYTLDRISKLPSLILHQDTGGELAVICLVLGQEHTLARVELFYTALESDKAIELFAKMQAKLWRTDAPVMDNASLATEKRYLGCRAFPPLEKVKDAISSLRSGSEAFFKKKLPTINLAEDRENLNLAVMYAVWHQFFCFGTRAICDAYQPLANFSDESNIGVLSDKDFSSHYKTRLVYAPDRLMRHMAAIESRLELLAKRFPLLQEQLKALNLPPVWLLDEAGVPVEVAPSSIAEILKELFPAPVNTPRKVMRNLLRELGLSHEHAEVWMGHWWCAREPFSPFSSFRYDSLLKQLKTQLPDLLKDLGFNPTPGTRA